MRLNEEEQDILVGKSGPVARQALQQLVPRLFQADVLPDGVRRFAQKVHELALQRPGRNARDRRKL